jgi:DNA-binding HxlR family transcriptional regulator
MVRIPEHSGHVCDRFHAAIELIGRRWTGAIVSVLLKGATRFCEIREAIPGISDRLLTERLKELEDHGIVLRTVSATRPPQVSYALTDKGAALQVPLDAVGDWAAAWAES